MASERGGGGGDEVARRGRARQCDLRERMLTREHGEPRAADDEDLRPQARKLRRRQQRDEMGQRFAARDERDQRIGCGGERDEMASRQPGGMRR